MVVTVTLSSYYGTLAGREAVRVNLADGSTAGDLMHVLRQMVPQIFPVAERATLIMNHCIVYGQTVLTDGETIVMIPPIAGG